MNYSIKKGSSTKPRELKSKKDLAINQVLITTKQSFRELCHRTKLFASKQKGLGI